MTNFEDVAELFNLDLKMSITGKSYYSHITQLAYDVYILKRGELEKANHDLMNWKCAAELLKARIEVLEAQQIKPGVNPDAGEPE